MCGPEGVFGNVRSESDLHTGYPDFLHDFPQSHNTGARIVTEATGFSFLIPSNSSYLKHLTIHDFYSSPSMIKMIKSRRMRLVGHVARMEEKRNTYRLLVGNPEGRRPLGRPRRRLLANVKMDLGEIRWGDVGWIDLAQDRDKLRALVNLVLNLRVP
jgi:hypothetical protein